jgi:hypothetical protein
LHHVERLYGDTIRIEDGLNQRRSKEKRWLVKTKLAASSIDDDEQTKSAARFMGKEK